MPSSADKRTVLTSRIITLAAVGIVCSCQPESKSVGMMPVPMLPTPSLDSVAPALGPSSGGIMLTIGGGNFVAGAQVLIGGATATVVSVNGQNKIQAMLPAGAYGKVPVVVRNPDGQQASRGDLFSYYATQVAFSKSNSVALDSASVLAAGDFNNDSKLDLAVSGSRGLSKNTVALLLGTGAGDFAAPQQLPALDYVNAIVSADFDGDKNLDLAMATSNSSEIQVWRGDGTGSFPKRGTVFPVKWPLVSLAVGDFNGDGRPDLVVGSSQIPPDNVGVMLSAGVGNYYPPKVFTYSAYQKCVAAGDFNDDGLSDFVVISGMGSVSLTLGDAIGNYAATSSYGTGTAFSPEFCVTGDFNGDKKRDLAFADNSTNRLLVLSGDGLGRLTKQDSFPVGSKPKGVAAGDFNGDQKIDLVVANQGGDGLSFLLGDGAGGFTPVSGIPAAGAPVQVVVGDWNGDDKLDVAFTTYSSVGVMLNQSR